LKSVSHPNGSWEKYDYDSFWNISTVLRPWKDLAMENATVANSRATIYGYSNSDNGVFGISEFRRIPFDIEEKINGITVRKTRFNRSVPSVDPEPLVATADASYQSSDNGVPVGFIGQVVTTRYHHSASLFLANRIASIEYQDGRKDSYLYEKGTYVPNADPALSQFTPDPNGLAQRQSIVHGTAAQPDGIAFKSTKETSVRDQFGNEVLQETYVYDGTAYERIGWTVNTYDDRSHLIMSRDHKGQLSTAVWTGDKKASEIDSAGVETVYTYDQFGRIKDKTKMGIAAGGGFPIQGDIVTTFSYDAEGRPTRETVAGGGLSLTTTSGYDKAGRLLRMTDRAGFTTDPEGLTTTYTYGNGGRTVTVTRPGGATTITDDYLDGWTKSVTGSAVVAHYFDYGVNADGTQYAQEFVGSSGLSSPRWTKTITDWLGRIVGVEKPSFTGTNVIEGSIYNAQGQLQKRTTLAGSTRLIADRVFEYDELGQQIRTGLDVDANGTLSLASTDRIDEIESAYEKNGVDWFRVTTGKAYLIDNSSTPTIQLRRERLNNFALNGTEQTIAVTAVVDGASNTTITTLTTDRAAKKQVATIDTPDSNVNAVSITVNGLLQSAVPTTPQSATTYLYDPLGRLTNVTDPRTGASTRTYSATTGKLTSTQDGATIASYDYYPTTHVNAGKMKSQTNAAGKKIYFNYNTRGEIVQTWGDATYPLEYVYDGYGQRTELHTFRGGYNWSASTWPGVTTGPADVTKWIYQPATGLLIQKQDAALKSSTYTYDELGRSKTRVWARGITTAYSYDSNTDQLRTISYSDGSPSVSIGYDRGGRDTIITDAAGSRVRSFNIANQLATEQINGGILDGIGLTIGTDTFLRRNSLQASHNANTLNNQTYGYDTSSRLQTINSGSQSVTYAYYPNSGLLNTTTFTGGTSTTRTYDAFGRLENITTTPAADSVQSYSYTNNNLNQRTRATFADGSYWSYEYNDRGELVSGKKFWTDNSIVWGAQTEYKFDNLGNRISVKAGGNQLGVSRQSSYTTNALNQYTQRTVPGAVDVTGTGNSSANISVNAQPTGRKGDYFHKELAIENGSAAAYAPVNVVGARNNFGPGGEDAVSEKGGFVLVPPALQVSTYDDDGNLTSDGIWVYTWDAENRLISMESSAALVPAAKKRLEFSYDYAGRRIRKVVYAWDQNSSSYQPQTITKFVYDRWNLITEIDGANVPLRSYVWGMDLSGTLHEAGGIGGLLLVKEGAANYHVGFDGSGNVSTLTDASSGLNAASYEYDPFGNLLKSIGPYAAKNSFQYSTRYTDSETGLVYFGYRYHSPSLGRFISRDPKEEAGGINLFSYVRNNPPNLNDKLGLFSFRVLFAAFIHKKLGEWVDEPASYNAEFKTDVRDFGEFDETANERTGNARLYSIVEVESTQIGKLEKGGVLRGLSATGMSHRRVASISPFWTGTWGPPESKRSVAKNPDPVIKDTGPCESTVSFGPSANYPFFSRTSPDIDYDIKFTLTRMDDKKRIDITIEGSHDEFPFYEAQVNSYKPPFYKYDTKHPGPTVSNLNATVNFQKHTFTFKP
jgi:RHS repeat-associated protein